MRRRNWVNFIAKSGMVMAVCLLAPTAAIPEQPAESSKPQEAGSVAASLGDLEGRVRELSSMLREMHSEIARSRAEAAELRRVLGETREQLATLRQQLGSASRAQTAVPGAPRPPSVVGPRPGETLREEAIIERVPRLEEEQQLLSAKVEDQYQTKIESASKYRVRLSGIALLNLFGTSGSVDNLDLPTQALRRPALDTNGSFGGTIRQSQIGLQVFGPSVAGAKSAADMQFDFFGGFPSGQDGVTAGLVRLRVARLRLDWARTAIVAGQDAPFFSPLSPTSLASLGYPALSYAGNLWTWTPQLRVEHRVDVVGDSSILVQGGVLDALTGEPPAGPFYRSADAGERGRQPAYATRLAWTRSGSDRPLSIGMGSYYARQNWGFGRNVDAWAATADWSVPFGASVSLTGEFYRGRAIGGLGGALGRSVLWNGPLANPASSVIGLNTTGGWAQLKYRPLEKLELNGAFGEDFPSTADLRRFSQSFSYIPATIGRNQSAFVNGIYHARSNLLLSLEFRRLWTSDIFPAKYTANQVNLGAGVLF